MASVFARWKQMIQTLPRIKHVEILATILAAYTTGYIIYKKTISPSNPNLWTPAPKVESAESIVTDYINKNNVMIFSTTTCSACVRAKKAFSEHNIEYNTLDMDKHVLFRGIFDVLILRTSQKTVPNVFVKGKHIGGCDSTVALLKSGELQKMLKDNNQSSNDGSNTQVLPTVVSDNSIRSPQAFFKSRLFRESLSSELARIHLQMLDCAQKLDFDIFSDLDELRHQDIEDVKSSFIFNMKSALQYVQREELTLEDKFDWLNIVEIEVKHFKTIFIAHLLELRHYSRLSEAEKENFQTQLQEEILNELSAILKSMKEKQSKEANLHYILNLHSHKMLNYSQQQQQDMIEQTLQLHSKQSMHIGDTCYLSGQFGNIYFGRLRKNKSRVAFKTIVLNCDFQTPDERRKNALLEVHTLHYLQGKYALQCDGYFVEGNEFTLVLEFAPCGSLWDLIHDSENVRNNVCLPFELILFWLAELADALAYIHSKGIVHKNLRADTVFLFPNLQMKLNDFNNVIWSKTEEENVYLAPECRETKQTDSRAANVYSFVMIAVFLMTRSNPTSLEASDQVRLATDRYTKECKNSSFMLEILRQGCLPTAASRTHSRVMALQLHELLDMFGGDPRERLHFDIDKVEKFCTGKTDTRWERHGPKSPSEGKSDSAIRRVSSTDDEEFIVLDSKDFNVEELNQPDSTPREFLSVCRNGNLDAVTAYMGQSACKECVVKFTYNCEGALLLAVQQQHTAIVQYLISSGASIRVVIAERRFNPLYVAIDNGLRDIAVMLAENAFSRNDSRLVNQAVECFVCAVQKGFVDIMKLIADQIRIPDDACLGLFQNPNYAEVLDTVSQLIKLFSIDAFSCKHVCDLLEFSTPDNNYSTAAIILINNLVGLSFDATAGQTSLHCDDPIFIATKLDLTDVVHSIVKSPHYKYSRVDSKSRSPLCHAKSVAVAELLFQATSSKDLCDSGNDTSPVLGAIRNGCEDVAAYYVTLLSSASEVIEKALYRAVELGMSKVLDALKSRFPHLMESTIYVEYCIGYAISNKRDLILATLLPEYVNEHTTAKTKTTTTCCISEHVLFTAIRGNNYSAVEMLLNRSANVNTLSRCGQHSVLFYAVERNNEAIVQLLLDNGAVGTAFTGNRSPLCRAIQCECTGCFNAIVSHPRSNLNELWNKKICAMQVAVNLGNSFYIRELIRHGANVITPLEFSEFHHDSYDLRTTEVQLFQMESIIAAYFVSDFEHYFYEYLKNSGGLMVFDEIRVKHWFFYAKVTSDKPNVSKALFQSIFDELSASSRYYFAYRILNMRDKYNRYFANYVSIELKVILQKVVLFMGRFQIDIGPPKYCTSTSIVFQAVEHLGDIFESQFAQLARSKSSESLQLSDAFKCIESLKRSLSVLSDAESLTEKCKKLSTGENNQLTYTQFTHLCFDYFGVTRKVVLKFMLTRQQYDRERSMRVPVDQPCFGGTLLQCPLDSNYVAKLLMEMSCDDNEAFRVTMKAIQERKMSGLEIKSPADIENPLNILQQAADFPFAIVLPAADRNLDEILRYERPDLTKARVLAQDVAKAIHHLHLNNIMHGDIQALNIVRIDNTMRLIDFDAGVHISSKEMFGKKYCTAALPPEIFGLATSASELPYYQVEANLTIDVWAFGVLLFSMVSCDRTSLLPTKADGDLVNTAEAYKQMAAWDDELLWRTILNQVNDDAAADLLKRVLKVSPTERLSMSSVLRHSFFNNSRMDFSEISGLRDLLNEVKRITEESLRRTIHIEHIATATHKQIKDTEGVLMRSIFNVSEIVVPTCFVILNVHMQQDDSEEKTALSELDGGMEQATKWIDKTIQLSNCIMSLVNDATNLDNIAVLVIEPLNNMVKSVVNGETLYFYLVDEFTMQPVIPAKGSIYPIEITTPSDFIVKVLPLLQVSLKALTLLNKVSSLVRLFGYPTPVIADEVVSSMTSWVDNIKTSNSVSEFAALDERVQDTLRNKTPSQQSRAKYVGGAALRELANFLALHDTNVRPDFCGLRRILVDNGDVCWTQEENVEKIKTQYRDARVSLATLNNNLKNDTPLQGDSDCEVSETESKLPKSCDNHLNKVEESVVMMGNEQQEKRADVPSGCCKMS